MAQQSMYKHKKTHFVEMIKCQQCSIEYDKRHKKQHDRTHDANWVACHLCNSFFGDGPAALNAHLTSKHSGLLEHDRNGIENGESSEIFSHLCNF